jgi:hypothetical protein
MHDVNSEALKEVEAELSSLEGMGLAKLRAFWSARWGVAPRLRSKGLLRHMIAWRLQSAVQGGLEQETRRLLRLMSVPYAPAPPIGSRLTREYRGELYEVEVCRNGYTYAGRTYGSLSEIARLVTGTRWNGPRFFGLRDRRATQ